MNHRTRFEPVPATSLTLVDRLPTVGRFYREGFSNKDLVVVELGLDSDFELLVHFRYLDPETGEPTGVLHTRTLAEWAQCNDSPDRPYYWPLLVQFSAYPPSYSVERAPNDPDLCVVDSDLD
jgi:hypothetical protein